MEIIRTIYIYIQRKITIRENSHYTRYTVKRTLITSNTKPGGPLSSYIRTTQFILEFTALRESPARYRA